MDLNFGIIGCGRLGGFHARALARVPGARLVAVTDLDADRASAVAAETGARVCRKLEELLEQVDALIVATPTTTHREIAVAAMEAGVDTLVEKPLADSLEAAEEIARVAQETGRVLLVGHIERFNPVFRAVESRLRTSGFIRAERLAPFPGRSLDVDVVVDLMIHDIDLVLRLVDSDLLGIDAVGIPVLTGREDIAEARIRFANGAVVSLTASRVSNEKVRTLRAFTPRGYASLDLLARRGRWVYLEGGTGPRLVSESIQPSSEDPLVEELRDFVAAIGGDLPVGATAEEASRALEIAMEIRRQVHESLGTAAWQAGIDGKPAGRVT